MESEGSFPCFQEPTNGLYPELDKSGPHLHIILKIHFSIILPPTMHTSPKWYLPFRYLLTPWSRILLWEANIQLAKKSPPFMESKGLLLRQDPTTGPYPKPDASSPHLPTLFP